MASDNQVALTRPYRGAAPNLSKAARQVVPQFLQKLYEMVNDPNNNELIRWADSGDSFFVLDHERFAREVLGRWFKHQNFASFVRQLNMYGFHKIPHLQQGVLKSESDTELWNFEHPHFHRGQPDLLCLIQRKKQAPQGGAAEDVIPDGKDSHPTAATHPNNAQVLDINSIINGIAAVKRHQQTISADLNELKNSNQHLWQEALAARERHKSHQDTINRILKFLASVFGRTNTHDNKDGAHTPPQPMVSRKRQRLMIADGESRKPMNPSIEDEIDDDQKSTDSSRFDDVSRSPKDPYATADSSSNRSPSIRSIDAFSPVMSAASPYFPEQSSRQTQQSCSGRQTPTATTPTTSFPSSSNDSSLELHRPSSTQPNVSLAMPQSTVPSPYAPAAPALSQGSQDAVLQAAFQQLMHSPTQMQRFMQALSASQALQPQPISTPNFPPPLPQQHFSQIAPYEPPADYSAMLPPDNTASAQALLPKVDEGIPLEPLLDNSARLQKSYKDSSEIDADVDALQASINSLIEGMGLDPAPEDAQAADFDLDAFLTQFAAAPGGAEDGDITGARDATPLEQMHAFMDEVASVPASPHDAANPRASAQAQAVAAHRKRKMDVAELAQELPLATPEPVLPTRAKRSKK